MQSLNLALEPWRKEQDTKGSAMISVASKIDISNFKSSSIVEITCQLIDAHNQSLVIIIKA